MQGNGILKGIIEYLNAKIKAAYPFEAVYGLSDLMDGKYTHYIGNGQSEHVTNFDKYAGTIFWLRNGNATIARAQSRTDSCNFDYQLTIPIRVVANLKKSLFKCDNETADDNLAMALLPIITDNGNGIKKAIGAQQLYIEPINYNVRVPSIAFNALYATVMMDFRITIIASLDCIVQDFCIDTSKIPIEIIKNVCPEFFVNDEKYINDGKVYFENGTNISIEIVDGKIVINSTGGGLTCDELESCQIIQDIINDLSNKLETVAVDGVTITGDGTVGNPLVAAVISTPLEIEQDGVSVEADTHKINVIYPIVATSAGANTVALQADPNSALNNVMLEVARFNSFGTDQRTMVYVASVNKLYVRQGANLRIYDCDTYELLATIAGTVVAVDYIPSAGEVWAQGTTTNTQRIDINTNTLIANIGGTVASKSKFIEYTNAAGSNTSVYGFVQANVTSIAKINVATLVTTTLNWSVATSRVWAALCLNPVSAMHRLIVATRTNASVLDIWDPETDTEVATGVNPSGIFGAGLRGIEYSASLDCFIVADSVNNIVAYLQPDTTSTFTVVRIIRTMQAPSFIVIDETNGLLLVSHQTLPTANQPTYVSKFRLSDGKPLGIVATGSIYNSTGNTAYMCKKGTESTVFVSGNNTATGVFTPISEVKYL
jgi:hypothetical protein